MALSYKFINAPSVSTRRLLMRRMLIGRPAEEADELKSAAWGAVLLIQGMLTEMYHAVDVGTKTSPVIASEVVGNCPQNVVTMAFVGNVADVKQVLSALQSEGVVI
ncbi:MAG: microcompartment protein [Synergistaceae bacterium]|jgi:hypothetical protein|nr:microcompartment protein [Synergistaceae bacterium]